MYGGEMSWTDVALLWQHTALETRASRLGCDDILSTENKRWRLVIAINPGDLIVKLTINVSLLVLRFQPVRHLYYSAEFKELAVTVQRKVAKTCDRHTFQANYILSWCIGWISLSNVDYEFLVGACWLLSQFQGSWHLVNGLHFRVYSVSRSCGEL